VHLRILIITLISMMAATALAQETPTTLATVTPSVTATPTALATEEAYVKPQAVLLQAEDGALLVGDFYLVDPLSPTIILAHQLYTTRHSWQPVISPLIGGHYNVLAIDIRGYGDSSSSINWHHAVTDMQLWFDWLRTGGGVRPDAISTMGSSMGSTLAIVGCANDVLCKTAIAISPGWDYYGIQIEDALTSGLNTRPMLILYAERDRWPSVGMPLIEEAATNPLIIERFPANTHGMDLIKLHEEEIIEMIIDWLTLNSGQF
jgi:pimeloyl-ACP methyl ester carboxylesterase